MFHLFVFEKLERLLLSDLPWNDHFHEVWNLMMVCVRLHMNGRPLEFPPEVLNMLMLVSKDVGNDMFKRKMFLFAHELYLLGIVIADGLRRWSPLDWDNSFVSILYSNLALSRLKLDLFPGAVKAANRYWEALVKKSEEYLRGLTMRPQHKRLAILLNGDNEKAYYRLALGHKGLQDYDKALVAARRGQKKLGENGNPDDRLFSELILELETHLLSRMPVVRTPVGETAGATAGATAGETAGETARRQPWSSYQPAPPKPPVTKEHVVASANATLNASSQADKNWLQGTNAYATTKEKAPSTQTLNTKRKRKKRKGKVKVIQPPSFKAPPKKVEQNVASSSSESDEDVEEEVEEVEVEEEEEEALEQKQEFTIVATKKQKQKQDVLTQASFGMGLDEFDYEEIMTPQTLGLPSPLNSKYMTRLACLSCYTENMGASSYVEKVHSCSCTILLCRSKEAPGLAWVKVRVRPQSMKMSSQKQFGGSFKLCQQYQAGQKCKLNENDCTFAHNSIEKEFWMADMCGRINIETYISQLKKILHVPASAAVPTAIRPQHANTALASKLTQPLQQKAMVHPTPPITPLLPPANSSHPQDAQQQQKAMVHPAPTVTPLLPPTNSSRPQEGQQQKQYQQQQQQYQQQQQQKQYQQQQKQYQQQQYQQQQKQQQQHQQYQQQEQYHQQQQYQQQQKQQQYQQYQQPQQYHQQQKQPQQYHQHQQHQQYIQHQQHHHKQYQQQQQQKQQQLQYQQQQQQYQQQLQYQHQKADVSMTLQSSPPRPLQGGISSIEMTGTSSEVYQLSGPPKPAQQQQSQRAENWLHKATQNYASKVKQAQAGAENIEFPLRETHDFELVCEQCLYEEQLQTGSFLINMQLKHKCYKNLLVVKRNGNMAWTHIRPRLNHRKFFGHYVLCRYFTAVPPQHCARYHTECSYAHSLEEKFLWELEKDGIFNIHAFILSSNKAKAERSQVDELFRTYGGQFHFLCGQCFAAATCLIVLQGNDGYKCARNMHVWSSDRLLVHVDTQQKITPISARPFLHQTAFFNMCHRSNRKEYCDQRLKSRCYFAHSLVERDVWYAEKDAQVTRDQIVQASAVHQAKGPKETATAGSGGQKVTAGLAGNTANLSPAVLHCPYNVIHVCDMCWKKGLLKTQSGSRCNGPGTGHLWELNKLAMLMPAKKQIRPLPQKVPYNCKFTLCNFIINKRPCIYSGNHCQFAHSSQEVEVWTWMVKNNVRTLDALVSSSSKHHSTATAASRKIEQGKSVVVAAATKVPAPNLTPGMAMDLNSNAQYCRYCGVGCNSRRLWDEHCASNQHTFNVNSDKEHQWNFRQPPWGILGSQYQLCELHLHSACQYSDRQDMYNLCQYAHTPEELDEWQERWKWRDMKRKVAKQEGVYSYMENLLELYESTDSGVNVITETIDGVNVSCDSALSVYDDQKTADRTWTFTVRARAGLVLEKVALLYDQDRLHFSLQGPNLSPATQIAQGPDFLSPDGKRYAITVNFSGGMFGSFMQWIVLDFGELPVVGHKLNVELGARGDQEKVKKIRQELHFDRWTGDNRQVVRFDSGDNSRLLQAMSTFNKELLQCYKAPTSTDTVITQQSLVVPLNEHNYMHKMHQLLNMEELKRQQIISRYNLETEVELQQQIVEDFGMIFTLPGELFARVPLNGQLSEDTNAGKLILTSVSRVLVAPQGSSGKVVYEAIIVDKENFDYDGRGKDYIYICLSPTCCRDLSLRANTTLVIELQFQMSRLFFCSMHKAVDLLEDTKMVFPNISLMKSGQRKTLAISSNVLNQDQMAIIRHVVAETDGYMPPLVIYGPFGTGKSETFAQATMLLLKQRPDARILICTQTNSAADLYILKHLDKFAESNSNMKMLRVYQDQRRLNTVSPVIQKYCLISADRTHFDLPTPEYVQQHHVVITTTTMALYLASSPQLSGHFRHIFIDEAAQALECEAIMPLALATDSTCVVLAGDHMQMVPAVYSAGARRQALQQSLLERLFHHYMMHNERRFNVLLRRNYRTRMEILRFVAATFYGGPDQLECCSNQPAAPGVPPLRFFAANGREVQDMDSTSFYNLAEVEETVARVAELYANWPADWGPPDAARIGVVTPYYDQLLRLRTSLRKRQRELRQVVVERVMNVQGKEFRALFITTVRTRHLLENPPEHPTEGAECDGQVGDLGFLSDEKLLNTAITRAASMVAVVGDPIALCIIGRSMGIWRTYLKHCQKMGTISPPSITIENIQAQVKSIMNSPLGMKLQRFADITRQWIDMSVKPAHTANNNNHSNQLPSTATTCATSATRNSPEDSNHLEVNGKKDSDDTEDSFELLSDMDFFNDWTIDYRIETDDILKQLAKEEMTLMQKSAWASPPQHAGGQKPQSPLDLSTPLKIEHVQVKQQHGHAVVHYRPNLEQKTRKRKLMSANDYDREFDSDNDMSDDDDDANDDGAAGETDFSTQQLMSFLQAEPNRYKRCVLNIESSMRMFAINLEPYSRQNKLCISSRQKCGRAFDQDEVVVEVIQTEEEDRSALPQSEQEEVEGRVIGILHRAIDPKYRLFVCTVDESNTGLMIPFNRGIPRIFNLETAEIHNKAKKGHVCVYSFSQNKEISFHHWEPVDQSDAGNKVFIVRYLKWDATFYSPLGIVVGVLPAGTTIEYGMTILNLEHNIPKKFRDETLKECEHLYPINFQVSGQVLQNRIDYRNKLCFTIDPPDSEDLDDALSIEPLPEDCYEVGIHIADVSFFVKNGSCIDNEARCRGTTYYPEKQEPIPMLPNRLSTDLCSLKRGKSRFTLSIMLTVNHQGVILRCTPRRGIIQSKHRLTYEMVETILTEGSDEYSEQLQDSLMVLQKISEIWRTARLGNSAFYQQLDADSILFPTAHMLVEELMVQTNHQVAKLLLQAFPDVTPLRHQLQPDELALVLWRSLHAKQAMQSVALTRAFLPKGKTCRCGAECTCIDPVVFEPRRDFVNVSQSTWESINNAVKDNDLDLMQRLIVNPELYPQQLIAVLQLKRLQKKGLYVCSGDTSVDDQWHYTLNLPVYTHFTSPIRRYVDLMVHRLVAAYIDGQAPPYGRQEMHKTLEHCTRMAVKARRYERATHGLRVNLDLQVAPQVLYPVVEAVNEKSICLYFPTMRHLTSRQTSIGMNHLKLKAVLRVLDDGGPVTLSWHQRIYDVQRKTLRHNMGKSVTPLLDMNRFMTRVPGHLWSQFISAIRQQDQDRLLDVYDDIIQATACLPHQPRCVVDLTSESANQDPVEHYVTFEAEVGACSVVRVQLASRLRRGVEPQLQLLSLTPTLDICLEHHTDPIRAFADLSTTQATKQNYGSVEQYRDSWLLALRMEAATSATSEDEGAVIHNVPIVWRRPTAGTVYAICTLPLSFCEMRQIMFSTSMEPDPDEEDDARQAPHIAEPHSELLEDLPSEVNCDTRYYDYVCVRYSDIDVPRDDDSTPERVTWVGHCLVTKALRIVKTNRLVVHMDLHQSAIDVPKELFTQPDTTAPRGATIEWIVKSMSDRRKEEAVCNLALPKGSQLAKDIALGSQPAPVDKTVLAHVDHVQRVAVPHLDTPNELQERVVRNALTQPFALIQGPPGTGKTVTGVRLAYLFTQLNRRAMATEGTSGGTSGGKGSKRGKGGQPQVLYCGPSNKSVDVVAHYLKKLGPACPRLLRVYSDRIESRDFPLPQDSCTKLPPVCFSELPLRDITLHHVIRQGDSEQARGILRWDAYFQNTRQHVTPKEVSEYQRVVCRAQADALKRADVILCTCITSSSNKLLNNTHIRQVIIDECGMCQEPEALVPIVALNPMQVVLIGDHRQLRPIVQAQAARQVGLERSLFERYSDKAVMLTTQYRMHKAIAEFPSNQFYDSQLVCGRDEQKAAGLKFWPQSRFQPLAFVHVVGCEKSLTVSSPDGSEQSKSNQLEVIQAVNAATTLNRRFHVKSRDIVILSQYRAQCAEIERQMHLKGQSDTAVSTVVASQGSEWDYVILSTVRSMPKSRVEMNPTRGWVRLNLGFITDQNQINVALTRARKGLIIIGNMHLLKVDPMWKKLLSDYHEKIVDTKDFMV